MDARTLSDIMGGTLPLARYEQLLPSYEKMLRIVGATTVTQCAVIAGQLRLESGGLLHQKEIWGPSSAQYTYDGRMGNRPGTSDWSDFRGHGWVQITGRDNHTNCSRWAHAQGITPDAGYFVRNPAELGSDSYCWVGPSWYFTVARAGFMAAAGRGDVRTCTQMINGGYTHLADRERFYRHALSLGDRILPGKATPVIEKVLDYPRDQVVQDTYYNCGPASSQTVIRAATGILLHEVDLGVELKTHTGGTNWIGQFPQVLNKHIPGAAYKYVDMPQDPPTGDQKQRLWVDIQTSINAGHGVVANIVAPADNYPRAVYPSTISPAYAGGTVYHYIALMGYRDDGQRKVWVADSGFSPFGYWITLDQLATLIPPKGYAYSTAPPLTPKQEEGFLMALTHEEQYEVLHTVRDLKKRVEKVEADVVDIRVQLRGPGDKGWPQLGKNDAGQFLSLVDCNAADRIDTARLDAKVNALTEALKEIK